MEFTAHKMVIKKKKKKDFQCKNVDRQIQSFSYPHLNQGSV